MLRDDTDSVYLILAGAVGLFIVAVVLGLTTLRGHATASGMPVHRVYRVSSYYPSPIRTPAAPTAHLPVDPRDVVVTSDSMYDLPQSTAPTGGPTLRAFTRPASPLNSANDSRPQPNVESVYFLPAMIALRPAARGAAAVFTAPAIHYETPRGPVGQPGVEDSLLPRLAPGSPIRIAQVIADPRGARVGNAPVYGALSGSPTVWLYELHLYNGSDAPVWLVPGQLRFDDGSTEDLYAWNGNWDTINGPEPGIPASRLFPFNTPDPADSSVRLPARQYTTLAVFAENSHDVRRDIDPGTGLVTITGGKRAPASMVFFQAPDPVTSGISAQAPVVERLSRIIHSVPLGTGGGQRIEMALPNGASAGMPRL